MSNQADEWTGSIREKFTASTTARAGCAPESCSPKLLPVAHRDDVCPAGIELTRDHFDIGQGAATEPHEPGRV